MRRVNAENFHEEGVFRFQGGLNVVLFREAVSFPCKFFKKKNFFLKKNNYDFDEWVS